MCVTLVIWSFSLYRPGNQKLEIYPLIVASERSEQAEIFVLLRRKHAILFTVLLVNSNIFVGTITTETQEKVINDCEQADFFFFFFPSETCNLLNILFMTRSYTDQKTNKQKLDKNP